MVKLLLTNDDGIFSEGLKSLADELSKSFEVVIVAPDREQSASGHSLTLHRPLRIRKIRENWFAVDGTPTDCVNLAIMWLIKDSPPDFIISGINFGLNLGNDVTYSGTVSATFEGSLNNIPSIAFSQEVGEEISFGYSAKIARRIILAVAEIGNIPSDMILNINIPLGKVRGIKWTKLGKRRYLQSVIEKKDPYGKSYFWIAGVPEWESEEGTDYKAISDNFVSITPLHLDLTDYRFLSDDIYGLKNLLENLELL